MTRVEYRRGDVDGIGKNLSLGVSSPSGSQGDRVVRHPLLFMNKLSLLPPGRVINII